MNCLFENNFVIRISKRKVLWVLDVMLMMVIVMKMREMVGCGKGRVLFFILYVIRFLFFYNMLLF